LNMPIEPLTSTLVMCEEGWGKSAAIHATDESANELAAIRRQNEFPKPHCETVTLIFTRLVCSVSEADISSS
jgi:hypothetical protein